MVDLSNLPIAEKRKKLAKMYFDYKEKRVQVRFFSLELPKEYIVSRWTLQRSKEGYEQGKGRLDFLYSFDQPLLRNQLQSHVSPFCLAWNAGKKLAKYDDGAIELISTSAEDKFDFLRLVGLYNTWQDASSVPAAFLHATRSTFLPVDSIQFPSEPEDDDWELQIKPVTKRQRASRRGKSSAIDDSLATIADDAPPPSERAAHRTRSKKTAFSIAGPSLG
ncbi:hypothetical protein DFS33DRAFT_348659 [Desarmillaria ectypa]|nr:hypothetical protein DFS33DRAFT_348659 [Desarmillaria ectypa]